MAVKIRLSRFGKKHQPTYRVVAIDEGKKRDGLYLENLGCYNPNLKPPFLKVNKERINYWLSTGAQMTQAVKKLLEKI